MGRLTRRQVDKWTRKTFFSRSSKSAFSRHDNVRASSALFVWLNENVLLSFFEKCVFSPWQCSGKPDIVHLAERKRSSFGFWHKNIRNIKKSSLFSPHYMPRGRCFQLVKEVLKELPPAYLVRDIAMFCRTQWGKSKDDFFVSSRVYCFVSVSVGGTSLACT